MPLPTESPQNPHSKMSMGDKLLDAGTGNEVLRSPAARYMWCHTIPGVLAHYASRPLLVTSRVETSMSVDCHKSNNACSKLLTVLSTRRAVTSGDQVVLYHQEHSECVLQTTPQRTKRARCTAVSHRALTLPCSNCTTAGWHTALHGTRHSMPFIRIQQPRPKGTCRRLGTTLLVVLVPIHF